MTITFYVRNGICFLDIGQECLLCVGTQDEVEIAKTKSFGIMDLINLAMAMARFKHIELSSKMTLH